MARQPWVKPGQPHALACEHHALTELDWVFLGVLGVFIFVQCKTHAASRFRCCNAPHETAVAHKIRDPHCRGIHAGMMSYDVMRACGICVCV